eukprot:TRINITY_DN81711_c0_g1_i1.p1 TRINITY_DN81711_c0_g1~~TRINITY_DN81711_c0_g1_i1.p1  ORF type:complete len:313 (+),score=44.90 TRINITY_DN81711_c0_g1_i1:87-1025(+)
MFLERLKVVLLATCLVRSVSADEEGDKEIVLFLHPVIGRVKAVSYGARHTLYLVHGGNLYADGRNDMGQLGDGTTVSKDSPVISWMRVVMMAAGAQHSCLVDEDRSAWCVGRNDLGQLGDGTRITRKSWVRALGNVVYVASGYRHSLFLKGDGTVWGAGLNENGQLGDGTRTQRLRPAKSPYFTGGVAIAAGKYHSVILRNDSFVYACGSNEYGQYGDGSRLTQLLPTNTYISGVSKVQASDYFSVYSRPDATHWVAGLYEGPKERTERQTLNDLVQVFTDVKGDFVVPKIPGSPYYPLPDRALIGGAASGA